MEKLTIEVDDGTIKEIKDCYGKADQETVRDTVENILDRYLHAGYLDSEIALDENNWPIFQWGNGISQRRDSFHFQEKDLYYNF